MSNLFSAVVPPHFAGYEYYVGHVDEVHRQFTPPAGRFGGSEFF